MFEHAPFQPCPSCGTPNLGRLMVTRHTFVRRCRQCRHTTREPLPDLDKRVIYLDQFALSEIFKLRSGRRRTDAPHASFWAAVSERVDRLLHLQQAVFPTSDVHSEETIVSPFSRDLRAASAAIAGNVSLVDTDTIASRQILTFARAFADGVEPSLDLDVDQILYGERNAWLPGFTVLSNAAYEVFAAGLRDDLTRQADAMAEVVASWQAERPGFDEALRRELQGFGRWRRGAMRDHLMAMARAYANNDLAALMDLDSNLVVREYGALHRFFMDRRLSKTEAHDQVLAFWDSPLVEQLPHHRIGAYLFAGLARQFATGRKKPLTRGLVNDVKAIAAYAPYVDAMLLDRECANLLREAPLKDELAFRARIFSLADRDAFIAYLDALIAATPDNVRAASARLYAPVD